MRKKIIAGNWKMNKTIKEAQELAQGLKDNLKNVKEREIILCPPFTALSKVFEIIKESNLKLGAQNMHFEDSGAYTGEISAKMLKDVGCSYVILGHSERRQYFAETDEIVNKKAKKALQEQLIPIICVGETLAQRNENKTFEIIESQVRKSAGGLNISSGEEIVIAYEPIWAIGTGVSATSEQAEEVHKFIRNLISKVYSLEVSQNIRIIYGGSINQDNIKELLGCLNIDGGLVGGASLKIESFTKIAGGDFKF